MSNLSAAAEVTPWRADAAAPHLIAKEYADNCAVGHEGHQLLRLLQKRVLPAIDKAAL